MVRLDLTPEQAWYLSKILDNIGGDPEGPRGEIDRIRQSLRSQAGEWEDASVEGRSVQLTDPEGGYVKGIYIDYYEERRTD